MKNTLTVLRRDLGSYFTSPIGYIFTIVFLLVSVGLYMTSFFAFPVADMRPFFGNLPLLLCIFIPAVTMRVWAEERKENTWELLLTFPMRSIELVMGKFLASLAFFVITLAATLTVPLMLVILGNPDNGALIGGYLGTILIGAFFLSIGIFFSGFCKDQIVAFVVTLLTCFAIFLLGTGFIASYIDGTVAGLGTLLSELVGVVGHYNAFTRGVIEFGDILYFVIWTGIFLMLNVIYIDSRYRPHAKTMFSTVVAVSLGIGFLMNWLLAGQSLGRFDVTEDKIYTVSDATKKILSKLPSPVQIKVYITPKSKMPTSHAQLEQDIVDKLEELQLASGGNFEYSTIHMDVSNVLEQPEESDEDKDEAEEAIERRLLDKGVQPFTTSTVEKDQMASKLIYSSIGVGYRDKKEEIIARVEPNGLPQLEYLLVNTIYKLAMDKKKVVALVAPKEAVNIPPEVRRMYQQMGQRIPTSEDPYDILQRLLAYEKYDVQRVELTKDSPLPDEFDTLAIINPRGLNDRQRWEINRALVAGKSVLVAVQNYEWEYRISGKQLTKNKREENPRINELLSDYGLEINDDILMDESNVPLTFQMGGNTLASLFGGGQTITVPLPTHILVGNSSMDSETSITSRLSEIFYLWGSAIKLDDDKLAKHDLTAKVIMSSSDSAWTAESSDATVKDSIFLPPASDKMSKLPLMVMVTGQFPDAFKDASRPTWPPPPPPMPGQPPMPNQNEPEGPVKEITPEPGKLIVVGCSEMFRRNFLQRGNLDLFLNSIDALTLGDDLVNVRGKKPIGRSIGSLKDGQRTFWKATNYAVVNIVIAAIGLIGAWLRRRSRNAYTVMYANE